MQSAWQQFCIETSITCLGRCAPEEEAGGAEQIEAYCLQVVTHSVLHSLMLAVTCCQYRLCKTVSRAICLVAAGALMWSSKTEMQWEEVGRENK